MAAETGVFADCFIAVEFETQTSFKTKQQLSKLITDHAGVVSYIVTRKVFPRCIGYFQLVLIILTRAPPNGVFWYSTK